MIEIQHTFSYFLQLAIHILLKRPLVLEWSNLNSLDRLPRRESERRNHPLIRHCDVLTAIETRISLLQMTFMKYVDAEACCFIPGKVIDELFEVLRKITATDAEIPRSYEVLQAGLCQIGLWIVAIIVICSEYLYVKAYTIPYVMQIQSYVCKSGTARHLFHGDGVFRRKNRSDA